DLRGLGHVVELAGLEDGAGAEVVAQAERVADLVRDQLDDVLVHEFGLEFGAERAARLEHRGAERDLLRHPTGVVAHAARVAGPGAREPRTRVVRVADRAHELLPEPPGAPDDALADADVGVVDLARIRVRARGADREGGVHGREPADGDVARVGRVPGRGVALLLDNHRVLEADLRERLVPQHRAFPARVAVFYRDC